MRPRVAATLFCLLTAAVQAQEPGPKTARYSSDPTSAKINLRLLELVDQARRRGLSLAAAAGGDRLLRQRGSAVLVEVIARDLGAETVRKLAVPGVSVRHVSQTYGRASLEVEDPEALHALAAIPEVVMIRADWGARRSAGLVDGRARQALNVPAVDVFGLDGAGQRVGILSDSFARTPSVRLPDTTPPAGQPGFLQGALQQLTGDLPATVLILADNAEDDPDFPLADEGAAMGELVRDIAPGASIAFHTGFVSEANFAEGITRLRTEAGCTVIVDDLIYFAEPMYQDGIIAQAAMAAVQAGVPYFSASGNLSNFSLRQQYKDVNPQRGEQVFPPRGNDLHDWGNGSGFLPIDVPTRGGFILALLQWNQPFQSLNDSSGAEIDLDMYVTASPTGASLDSFLTASFDVQGSTGRPSGDPIEGLFFFNRGAPQTVYLAIDHFDGSRGAIPQDPSTPLQFTVLFVDVSPGVVISAIPNSSSSVGGPTLYGHTAGRGVVSVGAVPWFDTPAFSTAFFPTAEMDPEDFTSRGGALAIFFTPSGAFSAENRMKPEIAAVDGNNTTFFGFPLNLGGAFGEPDNFPNFFGTSAAAPNAAAVGALLRQARPNLSPANLTSVLQTTAIDVIGTRAAPGWDDVTGAGLIHAERALLALGVRPPRNAAGPRWRLYR